MELLLGDVALDPATLTLLLTLCVFLTAVPCIVVLRGPIRWLTALAVTSALVLGCLFLLPIPSTDAKLALCVMYLLLLCSLSFTGAAYVIVRRRTIKTSQVAQLKLWTSPGRPLLAIHSRPRLVQREDEAVNIHQSRDRGAKLQDYQVGDVTHDVLPSE